MIRATTAARRAAVVMGPLFGAGLLLGPAQAQSSGAAVAALLADLDRSTLICGAETARLARGPRLALADVGRGSFTQLADATSGQVDIEDNLDLFEKLGLMEGHLLIGKALLDAKMQSDAMPHFGHPVRELYDYLKPAFAARNHPEFERELIDLEQRAKNAPGTPGTNVAYDGVIAKIDGLRRTIPPQLLSAQDFMLRAIALLIEDAADDLGESLDKGRITNTVEYHDAMGFARYVDSVVRGAGAVLGGQTQAVQKEIAMALAAFPSLQPPSRPARSVADVRGAGERVKALVK